MSSQSGPSAKAPTPNPVQQQGYVQVQLTPGEFQAVVNAAVQAATIRIAGQPQPAVPAAIRSTKDLKLADVQPFSGRTSDLEDFLNSCEILFSIKTDIYNDDAKKILYALQLMTQGHANEWRKQYLQENIGVGRITDSWNHFKAQLHISFKDVGSTADAMRWLSETKQGLGTTIANFNTRFRTKASEAGLKLSDDIQIAGLDGLPIQTANPNQEVLKHLYQKAIDPRIVTQVVINGAPDTIGSWMLKAAEIDSAMRRTRHMFGKAVQGQGKKNWRPKQYQRSENYGEPMDIDAVRTPTEKRKKTPYVEIPPQEKERRNQNNLCYKCGASNHGGEVCRTGWKLGPQPQASGSRPQQAPKKKFTPTNLRKHIRALISESFDDDDKGMEEFMTEVDELGF
jgi:hypothetical protein